MRLVDADELMEHIGRDRLDSREAIAQMIKNAPTIGMGYKTCPWCGSIASLHCESLAGPNGRGYAGNYEYYVQCDNPHCSAIAPDGRVNDIYRSSEEAKRMASEAWNKRGHKFKN